ncbi:Pimeloyl-ACP methyl ester carboxylesterase [Actinopolyspora xinjiangensis]|uniref:Pimeloyl-ACP methyl ester carboxylesterase n=1 Tax=Actinopolyspora xinjiangensis TaxID=405564 RepID=A0A1H0W860_9ACTN|nr:alpha/beta hydrolase [Actinopolyspora xinjiangensis]SDP86828.1 Pimeloyl-ACP methyl ester carboxylesterase [Actinopolyspora xinjiangensis]
MAGDAAGTTGAAELPSGARWRTYGSGGPVTLVVHGLGATEGEARIPASGLRGSRVVLTLPGHGAAADPVDGYWSYERVASDVLEVADRVDAERAVGVSLGAGALTRVAAGHPERFERLALLLPAAVDQPRGPEVTGVFDRLVDAVAAAEADGGASLREVVGSGLPDGADVGEYVEQRAATLRRLEPALRALPRQAPLTDGAELSAVGSSALVVGATADPLHESAVAERLAALLPGARLEMFDSAAPMLDRRAALRRLLTGFFND